MAEFDIIGANMNEKSLEYKLQIVNRGMVEAEKMINASYPTRIPTLGSIVRIEAYAGPPSSYWEKCYNRRRDNPYFIKDGKGDLTPMLEFQKKYAGEYKVAAVIYPLIINIHGPAIDLHLGCLTEVKKRENEQRSEFIDRVIESLNTTLEFKNGPLIIQIEKIK